MEIRITGIPDHEDILIEDAESYVLIAQRSSELTNLKTTAHANSAFLALASISLQGLAIEALARAEKED